jgi:hypothetical protein
MSEAFGGLLANLGKNMMQFADVQHSTKISSLEAEAQSRKELRLQEMQLSQNDITNAFRVADYESSQERLGIAQAADLRAQEKHDKTSYIWKEVPKYGWVEETVTEYDPMLQENVEKIKKNWEKIGSNWMGINEDDPKDRVVIGADGTYLSGDEANSILQSATESGAVSGSTEGGQITFAEYEANYRKLKPSWEGTPKQQAALREWAEGKGITFIDSASAAETPTAGAETDPNSSTLQLQHSVFQGSQSPFTPGSRLPDAANSTPNNAVFDPNQQWLNPSDPLGPGSFVPKPNPAETFVLSQGQGRPDRFPNLGTAVEEPSDAAGQPMVTDGGTGTDYQERMVQMDAIAPGGAVIDEAALDAAAEASDPATIAAEFGAPVVVKADGDIYAYDEAKSEAFVEGLIKDMQAVNISQEDIRKELLTLLGEVPKEQANGEFAKALATAYYEFTKGSN